MLHSLFVALTVKGLNFYLYLI